MSQDNSARSIERSMVVAANPDEVWAVVGDFVGLGNWHPGLPKGIIEDGADPTVVGAVRAFARDGAVAAREELTGYNPEGRSYSYRLLEPKPLPIEDYEAVIAVKPHPEGSLVTWSADYRSDDTTTAQVEEAIANRTFSMGLEALRDRWR
ncbi:SRPBCC family protein [Streptomyces sp. NPDC097610]|uniref:SRPBCC family protein n=1 Tax=Streptomyces sp. NPDC097610 TaxID=3157227 RepID=UPI00333462A6